MPNQPGEHRELKVGVTSRKMSPTELRFARASEDARRSRGGEHYRNLSVKEAEGFRDDMADTKRPDRLLVSQVRFPRTDIRARRIERVDFSEVDLEDVRFKPPPFRKPITISACTFRDAVLHGFHREVVFEDVIFERCSFDQFQLRDSTLRQCRFVTCTFSGALFDTCHLESVEMEIKAYDISWRRSVLTQLRVVGSARMGGLTSSRCDRVDLSGRTFSDFTLVLNTGRIEFPVSRDAFVIKENSALEARRLLEPQISPGSLRVLDKAVVPSTFTTVLANDLKEAPERDLILDTLYAHHVSHS